MLRVFAPIDRDHWSFSSYAHKDSAKLPATKIVSAALLKAILIYQFKVLDYSPKMGKYGPGVLYSSYADQGMNNPDIS